MLDRIGSECYRDDAAFRERDWNGVMYLEIINVFVFIFMYRVG